MQLTQPQNRLCNKFGDATKSTAPLFQDPHTPPSNIEPHLVRVKVVELLLMADADVNAYDNNGWTALHTSIANGREEVVFALLSGYHQSVSINIEVRRTLLSVCVAQHRYTRDVIWFTRSWRNTEPFGTLNMAITTPCLRTKMPYCSGCTLIPSLDDVFRVPGTAGD